MNNPDIAVMYIKKAMSINSKLQEAATNPVGTEQSLKWHSYDSIDDILSDALILLGEK